MKRRTWLYGIVILCVYTLMLGVMTAAESASPEASIQTFADSLWYSLVTLTTVGYGDLYPVTPVGRLIGGALVLLSMGFLAAVIGMAVSLFTGKLLPGIALSLCRRKTWFLFSERSEASAALAKDLTRRFPHCVCIFGRCAKSGISERNCFCLEEDTRETLARRSARCAERTVFLMRPDAFSNAEEALGLRCCPARVYCLGPENPKLEGVFFFDPFECLARRFWQTHPLGAGEERVLIAGNGQNAQALLEAAILSQTRQPFAKTEYHLFGDWSRWLSLHPAIAQAMALNGEQPGMDSLYFHDGSWFEDQTLTEQATRVILCHDDENANLEDALAWNRCFGGPQALYVRTSQSAVPGIAFGQAASLYTAEMIMKNVLDEKARQMHSLYRAQHPDTLPWEQLSAFTKASNRAAADHQPIKRALLRGRAFHTLDPETREQLRRCEHDRWLRFYSLYNWRFGAEKDAARRKHPCIQPYDLLSAEDRAKDDYAWQALEEQP